MPTALPALPVPDTAPEGPAPATAAPAASTRRQKKPAGEWKKRHADVIIMLARGHEVNGTLKKALIEEIKSSLSVGKSQIFTIWKEHKTTIMQGKMPALVRNEGSGRPLKVPVDEFRERIRAVPFHKRKTLRSLSYATGIPFTTLFGYMKRQFFDAGRVR
jgi:hypothetical protein